MGNVAAQEIGVRRRMTIRHAAVLLGIVVVAALVTIEFQRWEQQHEERRRALEQAQRVEEAQAKQERKSGDAASPLDEERPPAVAPPAAIEPPLERPDTVRRVDDAHELQQRIVALEAELARLRAELSEMRADLRAGDARRRRIGDHLAANELLHRELWRDLFEAVLDGEAVTKDPTRVFAPLLALAEATGLGNAERVDEGRRIAPEPKAPECELSLSRSWGDWQEGKGESARRLSMEGREIHARLDLRERPTGWTGETLSLSVSISVQRRSDGALDFELDIDGPSSLGGRDSEFNLSFEADGTGSVSRRPWGGDSDARDFAPGEFHELRVRILELYDKLSALLG